MKLRKLEKSETKPKDRAKSKEYEENEDKSKD